MVIVIVILIMGTGERCAQNVVVLPRARASDLDSGQSQKVTKKE